MSEEKESKYVEAPPVRFTCYHCGKEHEQTAMLKGEELKKGGCRVGFANGIECECGTLIWIGIVQEMPRF